MEDPSGSLCNLKGGGKMASSFMMQFVSSVWSIDGESGVDFIPDL